MTRPTREQVDDSLRVTAQIESAYQNTPEDQELLLDGSRRDQVILAREVRALREENERITAANWEAQHDELVRTRAENAALRKELALANKVCGMDEYHSRMQRLHAERDVYLERLGEFEVEVHTLRAERDALKAELAAANKAASEATAECYRLRAELARLDEVYGEALARAERWWTEAQYLRELRDAAEAVRNDPAIKEQRAVRRLSVVLAKWREKARQLRGYDAGMHEVEACADELEAVLAKVKP